MYVKSYQGYTAYESFLSPNKFIRTKSVGNDKLGRLLVTSHDDKSTLFKKDASWKTSKFIEIIEIKRKRFKTKF